MIISPGKVDELRTCGNDISTGACPILDTTPERRGALIHLISPFGGVSPDNTVNDKSIATVEPAAVITGRVARNRVVLYCAVTLE